jgi:hypothetical protein
MAQRLLKIILPQRHAPIALDILAEQEVTDFWQEESVAESHVVSVLIGSGQSEKLMDRFEKAFSSLPGFWLILIPVEAAIPRSEAAMDGRSGAGADPNRADITRISREELYEDIVDSTRLSRIFIAMVMLSTVVAAIGLLKNNIAAIIGAFRLADGPFRNQRGWHSRDREPLGVSHRFHAPDCACDHPDCMV